MAAFIRDSTILVYKMWLFSSKKIVSKIKKMTSVRKFYIENLLKNRNYYLQTGFEISWHFTKYLKESC